MDQFIRIRSLRGIREAELLEITPDERLRVRYLDTGNTAIVDVEKTIGYATRSRPMLYRSAEPVRVTRERNLMPVPKPRPPGRSFQYLDFIRAKPCMSCYALGPSDAHHWGPRGTGQKTDDYRTVPLCRPCHDGFHRSGTLPGREHKATRYLFLERQVDLLTEYLSRGVDEMRVEPQNDLRMNTEDMMPIEPDGFE